MSLQGANQCPARTATSALPWILRVGVAGCFIGHGAFGIITKAAWLPYFAVGGIHEPLAWRLMPWIGSMDVMVGLLALIWPCRALFIWAVAWTTWTALLRPLSGESGWEFWERAGNYGVPLALLVVVNWRGALFARLPLHWSNPSCEARGRLGWSLRLTTVALLVGHAGCILSEAHASFARNFGAIWPHEPARFTAATAWFELALALCVFFRPSFSLLLGVGLWKFATESLFVFAGSPVWEVVERFGSYAGPLALAYLLASRHETRGTTSTDTNHRDVRQFAAKAGRQN